MKETVVIFTENNARILVNPPDKEKFREKPNALINPDLSFVTGVEPHFWKMLPGTQTLELDDAKRLKKEIDDVVSHAQEETEQSKFYQALRSKLESEIRDCEKAHDLISKLLTRAKGIDREDVTTDLYDKLINHSPEPGKQKQNLVYKYMISQWEMGSVIPMSDDERKERQRDVKKRGAINSTEVKVSKYYPWHWFVIGMVVATAISWAIIKIKW